jgi:glucose-6-phosphate isomerase
MSLSHTAFQDLQSHQKRCASLSISELFHTSPQRANVFSVEAAGILLDYSKHLLDSEALQALISYAQESKLEAAITAMFSGNNINTTETRPALHVALRSGQSGSVQEKEVQDTLKALANFAKQIHRGAWTGFSGKSVRQVVNLGIGGSDLGPAMVYEALRPWHVSGIQCHFVSNVDPLHLEQTLERLDPTETLFIIASKSFSTIETNLNAKAAKRWLLEAGAAESQLDKHFVAVSAAVPKAMAFGINPSNVFPMWDWVGGRYSLWSAIGLPLILGLGMETFTKLLAGAHQMDEHFRTAPIAHNMPVLMAIFNFWYTCCWGAQSKVILPYAQNLHLLPAFLQQLDMESLGKNVHHNGSNTTIPTGSILWGSAGTNGQHSFHQLLHQGSILIPADFILVASSVSGNLEQTQQLQANCLAQAQALMLGKSSAQAKAEMLAEGLVEAEAERLAPHRSIPGNRPSSMILLPELDPTHLGALLALYEHKVYAQSVLLDINAFDQWGVELGKSLGKEVFEALETLPSPEVLAEQFDPSTARLLTLLHSKRVNN